VHKRPCENIFLFAKETGEAVWRPSRPLALLGWTLIGIALLFMLSCNRPDWFFGAGGKYNQAEIELLRGRAADLDKAIASLQFVVQDNPTYRDSLTLLSRAYYRKGLYPEAYALIQRALAVKKDDEIAWLTYGLAQMRLGEHGKGLETIKGGLTLLAKAMGSEDYRGYPGWDPRRTVRGAHNQAVFQALKGLDGRETLVQSTERLLDSIDAEEWAQRRGKLTERVIEHGDDS